MSNTKVLFSGILIVLLALLGCTGTPANGSSGTNGAEGPAGATGMAGKQGLPGAQGAQGPAGTQGMAGAAGVEGPAGPTGKDGLQGPAGPMGAPGATGAVGPKGATGPAGASASISKSQVYTVTTGSLGCPTTACDLTASCKAPTDILLNGSCFVHPTSIAGGADYYTGGYVGYASDPTTPAEWVCYDTYASTTWIVTAVCLTVP